MTKTFNWHQVSRILGHLVMTQSAFLLIAALVSFIYGEDDLTALLNTALLTFAAGFAALLIGSKNSGRIGVREGCFVVGVVWVVFSFFGMLPFIFSGYIPSVTDAYFETMSGFTTTGASILNDIESLPHGLLFWRSIIQWIGGMGIVVLSLAVLPMMGSGMQLYVAEVPGVTYDRIQPRIKDTARRLWGLYLILTLSEAILLSLSGMSLFDAICHSFTTMSSGGYSTKQASIAHWDSPLIQYIIIVFMAFAGINFSLIYSAVMRKTSLKKIFADEEFRTYLSIIVVITVIITIGLTISNRPTSFGDAELNFRQSLFQTVSIITTTGFATTDFMLWRPLLWMIILIAMFFGGSAGSTAGGMKVIRLLVVVKNMYYEFKRRVHPKSIMPVRVNRHVIPENTINNVHAFVTVYFILIAVSVLVLIASGMNIPESVGAAITSLNNVGPGVASIGPAGNFADIPTFSKWYLSLMMLIGRLEIFTILLLFSRTFWRK